MLLVLWVIRLLNGADITPRGQGVVFDCVIEFCLSPPLLFLLSGNWEGDFSVAAGRSGQGACLRFCLDRAGVFFLSLSAQGSPWRPLREKKNAHPCKKRASLCRRACVSVRVLVFVPQSAAALCRAVTCSQISQRIYHPVNCLWVVDKMPPIHPHMKTLWG